jgi:hypothetical protein
LFSRISIYSIKVTEPDVLGPLMLAAAPKLAIAFIPSIAKEALSYLSLGKGILDISLV